MTETELLGEVQRAISFTDSDDGAMSVNQLSDELAIGPASVRDGLRVLISDGVVTPCRVKRKMMNGKVQHVIAYTKVKSLEDKK